MEIPDIITCVDCGQKAHRLTFPPEDGWEIGDIVAYRCSGCMDRWDLVVADPEDQGGNNEFNFPQWLADRKNSDSAE